MNIRLTSILSLVAIALLAWFYSLNQDNNELTRLIKQNETPEYIGNKMQTIVYSPIGSKQYVATSDKVEYYQHDGHTEFLFPKVSLFDIENKEIQLESWHISAEKASLMKDNTLYLTKNVVVNSLLPQSKLQRIETESAVINLTTQDIYSDREVKINGLNFTSTGLKLSGNLQQQVANLKEQVKTYYEISKQNDN